MTDHESPITPEFPPKSAFRKWLRSLPADEVVAEDWGSCSCPLARWLLNFNIATPVVAPDREESSAGLWSDDWSNSMSPLPIWANLFAVAIDRRGERATGDAGRIFGPVTAADCLRVLSRTPRG